MCVLFSLSRLFLQICQAQKTGLGYERGEIEKMVSKMNSGKDKRKLWGVLLLNFLVLASMKDFEVDRYLARSLLSFDACNN